MKCPQWQPIVGNNVFDHESGIHVNGTLKNSHTHKIQATQQEPINEAEARDLPEEGIAPGTKWQNIPDDWACPDCGVRKSMFVPI